MINLYACTCPRCRTRNEATFEAIIASSFGEEDSRFELIDEGLPRRG